MTTTATRAPFLLSLIAAAAGVVGLVSAHHARVAGAPGRPARSCSARPARASPTGSRCRVSLALLCWRAASPAAATAPGRPRSCCSRVGAVLHVLKGLDVEEALLYLAILAAALAQPGRCSTPTGDPGGPPRAVLARARARLLGLYRVRPRRHRLPTSCAQARSVCRRCRASRQITYGLVGQDVYLVPGRFDHDLTLSLARLAFVGCAAYVLWIALRPRDTDDRPEPTHDRADARRPGRAQAAATRSPTSPCGATSRTSSTRGGAPSSPTAPSGGVALVSGDPIGDADGVRRALASRSRAYCHEPRLARRRAGRRRGAPRSLGTRRAALAVRRRRGDRAPERRSRSRAAPIRKVRQSVTRLRKAGYRAEVVRAGDLDDARWLEIERVTHAWLRGEPERGFSMALDDMLRDPEHARRRVHPGARRGGPRAGFLHFVPVPGRRAASRSRPCAGCPTRRTG